MNYVVSIEGQSISIPEDIGREDDRVKKALAPYYPEVANALITRVEKDETTTITVVKRAGTKGLECLDYLLSCPSHKNPAIELYEQINTLGDLAAADPAAILALSSQIDDAITAGTQQEKAVDHALERLANTKGQSSEILVMGF